MNIYIYKLKLYQQRHKSAQNQKFLTNMLYEIFRAEMRPIVLEQQHCGTHICTFLEQSAV